MKSSRFFAFLLFGAATVGAEYPYPRQSSGEGFANGSIRQVVERRGAKVKKQLEKRAGQPDAAMPYQVNRCTGGWVRPDARGYDPKAIGVPRSMPWPAARLAPGTPLAPTVSADANFATGDIVLDTFSVDGSVTIAFGSAVTAVGLQIQHLVTGGFDGTLSVYDPTNTLMNTFTVSGTAGLDKDGSALFLGARSDLRDIMSIQSSVSVRRAEAPGSP